MSPEPATRDRPPGRRWPTVFLVFARIGATSFGGGSATIAAMRAACLRRGRLDEEAFVDTVVLSRLTPGITIVAQVLLIGRAVAGVRGMVAGALGMMLPSITITIALAALYTRLRTDPVAAAPLAALAALAAGFAVALALQLLRDVLRRGNVVRGVLLFGAFLALAAVVTDPLVPMGVALVAALALPGVFDPGPSDGPPSGEESHG